MESSCRHAEKTSDPAGVPWRALAGSVGLHVLVLAGVAPQLFVEGSHVPPERVLQARLAPLVAPEDPTPRTAPQTMASRPLPVLVHWSGSQAVAAVPVAVPPVPTIAAPMPATAETGGVPAGRDVSAPVTVAVAQERRDSGPDAAGLRQYRLALAGEAKRFRRYPEAARRDGLTGTAEVRVVVVAGERLAELSRSSGHAMLDAAALDMLRQAAQKAKLPESLLGQQFAVLLPVVFEVEE